MSTVPPESGSGLTHARLRPAPGSGTVVGVERDRLRATFGTLLAAERAVVGWSQRRLAERCGVDRRHIERMERGERRPSTTMVWRLSRALRPISDDDTIAELAARFQDAAGPSLRDYSSRPRRRQTRLVEQARAGRGESDPGVALVVARVTAALRPEEAR